MRNFNLFPFVKSRNLCIPSIFAACLKNIREVTTYFLVTNAEVLGKPTLHEVLDKRTK